MSSFVPDNPIWPVAQLVFSMAQIDIQQGSFEAPEYIS